MRRQSNLWRGMTSVFAFLLSFSLLMTQLLLSWSGQVNVFLNVTAPVIEADASTMQYKSDYELSDEGLKQMLADSDKHDVQTMEEGTVLLKNEQAVLPLSSEERSVTLFGRATADPVYSGNAGGRGWMRRGRSICTALCRKRASRLMTSCLTLIKAARLPE